MVTKLEGDFPPGPRPVAVRAPLLQRLEYIEFEEVNVDRPPSVDLLQFCSLTSGSSFFSSISILSIELSIAV